MSSIRSIKTAEGWCWQEKRITRYIRENLLGKRLTTALAIYQVLTELASNQNTEEFYAYYSQIAKLSGKSTSTIKIYCKEFIKLEILSKENRRVDDKTNLSNKWSLLTPSVNNNYQTSLNNVYSTLVKEDYQQLEENELEEEKKNGVETESYKRLKEKVELLRRTHA
jgi:hypothetical protein